MNRNSVGNIVLFVVLSVAVLGGWWLVETYLIPKPPPPTQPEAKEKKPARETVLALAGGGVAGSADLAEWPNHFRPEAPPKPADPPKPVEPSVPHRLIGISGEGYNLRVLLTNKGAGVQQVVLPVFDQASREGTTAIDEHTGKPYPLELVPGYYRPVDRGTVKVDGPHHFLKAGEVGKDIPAAVPLAPASYTLLHYEEPDAINPRPSKTLTDRKWTVVSERAGTDDTPGEVVFETTLDAPYFVRIRKTFTLAKTDFHVRMKLEFFAAEGRTGEVKELHYQISGPRNVPIEGEWYSGVLRNAVIAWKTPSGKAERELHDAAHITTEWGIPKVEAGYNFTFAAVVNQFFAAAIAIDPDQQTDATGNIWKYVRATREWDTHPLHPNESDGSREAFYADKPQLGDITVRVRAKPIKPASTDKAVTHSYWLYHGPTKVRLLNSLYLADPEQRGYSIPREVVDDKYEKAIGLNVITDAPSPGPFGWFAGVIHWTDLVVWFTNIMHDILGWLHLVVPMWGVNILMLTVIVRLVLMLPSRRQQAGMMKMQDKMAAMKPEMEKIQEKYKNDPQRLNQEKTRLMLQHGVNPLTSMGGCLLMFAQMPVFLGLYYCLQESVFFRLDKFLWIQNLAAPDMLFTWSESIPFISSPDQIGHSWYLGPFFNLLPILAVTLMYINFKISSPPPTDEQQEMQQRTMKFMMIFMGVFFYKMAAGLCLYFICSTLWGMTERWLLKKKKKADAENPTLIVGPGSSANGTPAKPAGPPKPPGFFERVKQGLMDKLEEAQRQAESQGQQIINNPKPGPGPGPKPPQGGPPQPGMNGPGGKKKKRRKK